MRKVSLVKGGDRAQNIHEALKLIKDDIAEIRDRKRILIKPNLTSDDYSLANTSSEAVRAVISFLKQNIPDFEKKEVTVGESSGMILYKGIPTMDIFERFGYLKLEREFGNVKIKSFDNYENFTEILIETVNGRKKAKVVNVRDEYDYLISVAVPKMHDTAIATLGIKNMMGLIKPEYKPLMHGIEQKHSYGKNIFKKITPNSMIRAFKYFSGKNKTLASSFADSDYRQSVRLIHENLLSLAHAIFPDLVILDGFYGMEGEGPGDGSPVESRLCILSTDPVKADSVGAKVMGLEPGEIGYLVYLEDEGFGYISTEGLVGEGIEDVAIKYKTHSRYELQRMWN